MDKIFAVSIDGTVVARFDTWDEACRDADLRNEAHAYDLNGDLLPGAIEAEVINLEQDVDDPTVWERADRYLSIVRWAKRRYTVRRQLVISVNSKPSRYSRIERAAFDRYVLQQVT